MRKLARKRRKILDYVFKPYFLLRKFYTPWLFQTLQWGGGRSEDIWQKNQAEKSFHLGSCTASTAECAGSHYPYTPEKAVHDVDGRKTVKEPESSSHLEKSGHKIIVPLGLYQKASSQSPHHQVLVPGLLYFSLQIGARIARQGGYSLLSRRLVGFL